MSAAQHPTGGHVPEVRATLDAFRRIVQALRGGADGRRADGISAAQLFALQQVASHPDSSVNDIAARTFTHQSSVSVVIKRLVAGGLVAKVPARDDRRRTRLTLPAVRHGARRRSARPVRQCKGDERGVDTRAR